MVNESQVAELVTQKTRARIYEYIKKHPGVHITEMERSLKLAPGNLAYHLRRLSDAGMVRSLRYGLRTFVFPADLFGEKQEVLMGLLTLTAPRDILLCILEAPGITQKELAGRLKHSAPTIWWHIDRLARLGVISRRREGRTVVYQVIANPREILDFIRNYQPGTWERWASRMHDISLMLAAEDNKDAPE